MGVSFLDNDLNKNGIAWIHYITDDGIEVEYKNKEFAKIKDKYNFNDDDEIEW